jgi:hypothetical protein
MLKFECKGKYLLLKIVAISIILRMFEEKLRFDNEETIFA